MGNRPDKLDCANARSAHYETLRTDVVDAMLAADWKWVAATWNLERGREEQVSSTNRIEQRKIVSTFSHVLLCHHDEIRLNHGILGFLTT